MFLEDGAPKMAVNESVRVKMVENQLRANKVVDERLTEVMRRVERERFVPLAKRSVAYADEALQISANRWLMEPMLFARLSQLADVRNSDLVLVVGAGMGYGAAVLASLASAVVALEEDEDLAAAAAAALAGIDGASDNVVIENGELTKGWDGQAPYDVIFVEGAIDGRPNTLLAQLAEGGRLVAMETVASNVQRGVLYLKRGDSIARREVFDGSTPVLPGFASAPVFSF